MPRQLRVEYPGAHYHAMCRGNDGQDIFVGDEGRRLFLSTLGEACDQTGWRVHAYVLMTNHYHLLLETPEANLVAGMKWFQGAYTQRFNAMYKRRGHLFQGRYKAIPVATDPQEGGKVYFRQVSTYIHLNPFRAKICGEGCGQGLETFAWSSYPAYCGVAWKRPEWLVRSEVLGCWGLTEGEPGALDAYRGKLERLMRFEGDPDAGRRGEFEAQVKRGWYIGSAEFREKLLDKIEGLASGDNFRSDQKRAHNEAMAERLLASALAALGLTEEALLGMKANRLEKQAVAWLLKSETTVTGEWLSSRLRLGHASNCSRALKRFRESRAEDVMDLKRELTNCKGMGSVPPGRDG